MLHTFQSPHLRRSRALECKRAASMACRWSSAAAFASSCRSWSSTDIGGPYNRAWRKKAQDLVCTNNPENILKRVSKTLKIPPPVLILPLVLLCGAVESPQARDRYSESQRTRGTYKSIKWSCTVSEGTVSETYHFAFPPIKIYPVCNMY